MFAARELLSLLLLVVAAKWVFNLRSAKFLLDQLCNSCSSVLQMCVCVCGGFSAMEFAAVVAGAVLNPFLGSQFWAHFGVIIWDPSMLNNEKTSSLSANK